MLNKQQKSIQGKIPFCNIICRNNHMYVYYSRIVIEISLAKSLVYEKVFYK